MSDLTENEKKLLEDTIELIRYQILYRTKAYSMERNLCLYALQDAADFFACNSNCEKWDEYDLSVEEMKKLLTTKNASLRQFIKEKLGDE